MATTDSAQPNNIACFRTSPQTISPIPEYITFLFPKVSFLKQLLAFGILMCAVLTQRDSCEHMLLKNPTMKDKINYVISFIV